MIEIEVTPRELAEAGIIYTELGWEKLEQTIEKRHQTKEAIISLKDIAEAAREQSITTTEAGGFKGFIKKWIDKFKGKGEK